MANEIEIKIPDIGGSNQVDVIEILVKVGDEISIDTPLITLESDKASMEIPSPSAGTVSKINVKIGDKVAEGDIILLAKSNQSNAVTPQDAPPKASAVEKAPEVKKVEPIKASASELVEISIPDIGGAHDVDVIDVMVKVGMIVEKDQSLVTLEGDKATMDIPCPYSGTVKEIKIKLGDKVSQGTPVLVLESSDVHEQAAQVESPQKAETPSAVSPAPSQDTIKQETPSPSSEVIEYSGVISAGPAVRRMARELGVNLTLVKGNGRKARITKEDIQTYVKTRLAASTNGGGTFNLPSSPAIDFTKFGEIEAKPLNKIKKMTGVNVHRSWITIPHVTQFDEADITDLEDFRKAESNNVKDSSYKLTLLAFVCKVVSKALHVYPQFNASLDPTGEQLIYKKYCNIGIAVETPNGLVVPVIKAIDTLTVAEIAKEMSRLSAKARDKGLMPGDMSGGCFTISSLGGIGGTAFTPIVNSPEVAILGLSRSAIKPVYINNEFKPRLMLPLSLSYDHRVIDGAEAARFTAYIRDCLSDIRKILI